MKQESFAFTRGRFKLSGMLKVLLFFLLLWGCSPNTSEDLLAESEVKCRGLVVVLEKIDSLEDLIKMEPTLSKKFNEIAKLMIDAHKFHEKHPLAVSKTKSHLSSGPLLEELKRIYAIKGGRELMERAQADAYLLLKEAGL